MVLKSCKVVSSTTPRLPFLGDALGNVFETLEVPAPARVRREMSFVMCLASYLPRRLATTHKKAQPQHASSPKRVFGHARRRAYSSVSCQIASATRRLFCFNFTMKWLA
jgi:hypothetical protein